MYFNRLSVYKTSINKYKATYLLFKHISVKFNKQFNNSIEYDN